MSCYVCVCACVFARVCVRVCVCVCVVVGEGPTKRIEIGSCVFISAAADVSYPP